MHLGRGIPRSQFAVSDTEYPNGFADTLRGGPLLAHWNSASEPGSGGATARVEHLMQAAAAAGKRWFQGLAHSRAAFG